MIILFIWLSCNYILVLIYGCEIGGYDNIDIVE